MFGLEMLDVAIGIIFVYLLMSLICSAFNEIIEAWFKKRATYLEWGIRGLLNDPSGKGLVTALYNHPLIYGLFEGIYNPDNLRDRKGKTNLPSYIPARNFALALMDTVLHPPGGPDISDASTTISIESLRSAINTVENEKVKQALRTFVDGANNDINKVQESIEAWYNSLTDRVSGWYKRYTQVYILIFGLLVVIILNADTIAIVRSLALDPVLRNSVITAAQQYLKDNPAPPSAAASGTPSASSPKTACERDANSPECRLERNLSEVKKLGLPIGWNWEDPRTRPRGFWLWIIKAFGWLLTAFAISLGAPFWFDLLNKFMVIRSTVKPREKSPEEASEDRQPSRSRLPQGTREREPQALGAESAAPESFQAHAWAQGNPQEGIV